MLEIKVKYVTFHITSTTFVLVLKEAASCLWNGMKNYSVLEFLTGEKKKKKQISKWDDLIFSLPYYAHGRSRPVCGLASCHLSISVCNWLWSYVVACKALGSCLLLCCFSGENPSLLGGLKWPKTHDTAIFQAHFTQQQNTCRSRAWYPFHLIAAHSLVNRNFPTVDTFIHFLKDRNNNEINKIKFHRKTKVFSYPILFNNNKKIVT